MSRSLLQNVYLFKTLSPDELNAVNEIAQEQHLHTGESVFLRGEPATAMYFVKFGSIRIQQTTKAGDTLDVSIVGTGSHFGEMSLMDGEARSATALAAENTELVAISYEKLNHLLSKNSGVAIKLYKEMAKFMCARLRSTTIDLGFAREKNLSHF